MKFNEMKYERVQINPIPEEVTAKLTALENAKTFEEQLAVYKDIEAFVSKLATMVSLCYARYTINTEDEFYSAENDYYDENLPNCQDFVNKEWQILLKSPFRKEFEKELGTVLFKNKEMLQRAFSPEIMADLAEENRLQSRYQKLIATAKIPFEGKELTIPQINAKKQDVNRDVRKAAYAAEDQFYTSVGQELDEIFDQMVKVRTRMAKKLGYKSYTDMGYDLRTRNCYTRADVEEFRAQIREHIVPINNDLLAKLAKRNNIEKPMVWDRLLTFKTGNPTPKGTPEEMFEYGKKMYEELSPETGDFFNFMLRGGLFDVLSKPGKANGGYCTTFPDYKSPFIFANFVGTSDDVDVLTHEAGHAYAAYVAFKTMKYLDQMEPTMDIAEIHSMSMEMFTYPWMNLFFKEDTEKYYYAHTFDAFKFLPYGCMVDHFQHIMYDQPDLTPAQRHEVWLDLERQYRPDIDFGDLPYHAKGGVWQQKLHIYMNPFYYIDYCFAQYVALCFFGLMQQDRQQAWKRYVQLVKDSGDKDYVTLVKEAGFKTPMEQGAIKEVAQKVYNYLNSLDVSAY